MNMEDRGGSYAISIRALSKTFGSEMAIRKLDQTVSWGDFLVIFGPNGAGKTTLIKILSTITSPTNGEVSIAGFDLKSDSSLIRRNIGVVSHQSLLYQDLSTIENLRFHGKMFSVPGLENRIMEVADIVGIQSILDHKASVLSHGMQKRVSIARAILHDPPIMLLDEPETSLDQEALSVLKNAINQSERGQRTVLMVTHSLERGWTLGDRVAILARGNIVYENNTASLDQSKVIEIYNNLVGRS